MFIKNNVDRFCTLPKKLVETRLQFNDGFPNKSIKQFCTLDISNDFVSLLAKMKRLPASTKNHEIVTTFIGMPMLYHFIWFHTYKLNTMFYKSKNKIYIINFK